VIEREINFARLQFDVDVFEYFKYNSTRKYGWCCHVALNCGHGRIETFMMENT